MQNSLHYLPIFMCSCGAEIFSLLSSRYKNALWCRNLFIIEVLDHNRTCLTFANLSVVRSLGKTSSLHLSIYRSFYSFIYLHLTIYVFIYLSFLSIYLSIQVPFIKTARCAPFCILFPFFWAKLEHKSCFRTEGVL